MDRLYPLNVRLSVGIIVGYLFSQQTIQHVKSGIYDIMNWLRQFRLLSFVLYQVVTLTFQLSYF